MGPINAVRQRNSEYRALFPNMIEGAAHCRMILDAERSPDFVFLSMNKAFVALTGFHRAKGRKMSELFAGGTAVEPEILALFHRAFLSGVHQKLELYVHALSHWLPISTYSSSPGFFLCIFEVVTARRKAEFAARRRQRAFDQSGTAMGLANVADGTVESLNPPAARMLGYTTEEVIGRPVAVLCPPSEWVRRASAIKQHQVRIGPRAVPFSHAKETWQPVSGFSRVHRRQGRSRRKWFGASA
jgi:PAS domain S-box-containing protein